MKIVMKIAAIVFVCSSISSCSGEKGKSSAISGNKEGSFRINTATVAGRDVQRTVEATGTLAPWEEVMVSSEIPGTVDRIFVDLGDEVAEGRLMLRLNQQDAKAGFDSAEATLETNIRALERAKAVWTDASSNLKRYTNLFSEGVVSISQRDAIQTQYEVADAQLKQAEAQVSHAKAQFEIAKKQLSDTESRAPISGHIKKRFVSTGEAIKDKDPLFIIVKNDPLKFQGAVPESFAADIMIGKDVFVYIDALSEKIFSGKISRVSPSIDEKTRTLSIEAMMPNPNNLLKSGFFATATIITKKDAGVSFVPQMAVYSSTGINKVYVIEDGAARERLVKTGMREAGLVEIIEGVKAGEIVATSGLDQLFDGAKVEVK